MFLIKYFIDSFKFKELLVVKERPIYKLIIYYVILIFIATFPMAFQDIKYGGSNLEFVVSDFKEIPLNWNFPAGIEIRAEKLVTPYEEVHFVHQDVNYYFLNQETIDYNNYKNSIVFLKENIVYINNDGKYMEGNNYKSFNLLFEFDNFRTASGDDKYELYQQLASNIEDSFGKQIVFYTILRNVSIQLFINILYIIILSLLLQLYKFGYQKFISYYDGLKFVIVALGPAAIFAFLIGLLEPAFSPVAFQLVSGLTVMLVPLLFGKKIYS